MHPLDEAVPATPRERALGVRRPGTPNGIPVARRDATAAAASLAQRVAGGRSVDVAMLPARRPVLHAVADGLDVCIVKVAGEPHDLGIENEAWALDVLAHQHPEQGFAPRLLGFDGPGTAVALEVLTDSTPFRQALNDLSAADVRRLLSDLASTLAAVHAAPLPDPVPPERILELGLVGHDDLTVDEFVAGVGAEYGAFVEAMQPVAGIVREVRAGWTCDAFVHFDLHLENLRVRHDAARGPRAQLLDWEIAGYGDPLWDVATIAASLLERGLALTLAAPERASEVWAAALQDLETFLDAYAARTPSLSDGRTVQLHRYVGVQTMLLARARLERGGRLGSVGEACLRLGRRWLDDRVAAPGARIGTAA